MRVVGLDIGTNKIVCAVGELNENGKLTILSKGEAPSKGIDSGTVIDISEASGVIRSVVSEAQGISGGEIKEIFVAISGNHISSTLSSGIVSISGKKKLVVEDDVRRVLNEAGKIEIPSNREILSRIPLGFSIDNKASVRNPISMNGVRLATKIHLITADKSEIQNLRTTVEQAGLEIKDFVFSVDAASYDILGEDEKKMGVCLVDIGAGSTKVVICKNGFVQRVSTISIGAKHVTSDLSVILGISTHEAERVKIKYGVLNPENISENDHIKLVRSDNNVIEASLEDICSIIRPRMKEIFDMIYQDIHDSGYEDQIAAGITLVGGGATLEGTMEVAGEETGKVVRMGFSKTGITGVIDELNNPEYATIRGLLLYAEEKRPSLSFSNEGLLGKSLLKNKPVKSLSRWLKQLLEDIF